ncbi:MAG: WD40 repeat domain-containing protein, partial [Acidimicrobiia bacterium]
FTLVDDEKERAAFLELLRMAATDPLSSIRMVLTIRADFFDRPLRFADFGDLLRVSTVPVTAPDESALREIIERPASGVGIQFAAGLVERMVGDVKDQPGALPLLEFSLTELFNGRKSDELTLEAYDQSGGVVGALGRRAESIYVALHDAGREAARQVFMRFVNVAEAEGATRRRVRLRDLEELGIDSAVLRSLLQVLADHRLVTFDRDPVTRGPTVEIAHEAILKYWPRLAEWIANRREDLLLRSRLALAVADWEDSDRSEEYLLDAARLGQHETWLATTDLSLTKVENDFIRLSRAEADRKRDQQREDRSRVEAVFAATQAIAQLEIDPEQSLLLALEGAESARDAGLEILEVSTALRRGLAEHRILRRFDGGRFGAVSPDGKFVAAPGSGGEVIVRSIDTGEVATVLDRPGASPAGAQFAAGGKRLAVTYLDTGDPLSIWDLETLTRQDLDGVEAARIGAHSQIDFDDAGDLVATLLVDGMNIWSTASGRLVQLIESRDCEARFVPGSNTLMFADWAQRLLRMYEPTTGEMLWEITVHGPPSSIAVSADGRLAVVTYQDAGKVVAYQAVDGVETWTATVDRPAGACWLADGQRVAVGGEAGRMTLIDGAGGHIVGVLRGGHGTVWSLAGVPGRDLLVTSGVNDGTTLVWDTERGLRPEIARFDTGVSRPFWVGLHPSSESVFVSDQGTPAVARVLSMPSREIILEIANPTGFGFSSTRPTGDGSQLAVTTDDGVSSLMDMSTGRVLYQAPAGLFVHDVSHNGALAIVGPDISTAESDELRRVIEVASGRVVCPLPVQQSLLLFSDNDRYLISWAGAGVSLLDPKDGRVLVHIAEASSVEPMPDDTMLSVVDHHGMLWRARLNDLLSGRSLEEASEWSTATDRGTLLPTAHVANSDGSLLATMARGKPARIWDAATGTQVASLDARLVGVSPYVYFHPHEQRVTLLADGGVLLTYTLDTDELIEIAKSRVTRTLTDAERRS